jgi:hypothetical protein
MRFHQLYCCVFILQSLHFHTKVSNETSWMQGCTGLSDFAGGFPSCHFFGQMHPHQKEKGKSYKKQSRHP